MRIGLVTRYHATEACYMALRVAAWVTQQGYDATLFCEERQRTRVDPAWDKHVCRPGPRGFTKWADQLDAVVWTHCPLPEQIAWANRRKKRTIVVPLWHELRSESRRALRQASCTVLPSRAAAELLRSRWRLRLCMAAPWDCGEPMVQKVSLADPGCIRTLLPLFDNMSRYINSDLLVSLATVVQELAWVSLTLAYTPSQLSPGATRFLQSLAARCPSRITLLRHVAYRDRPLLYGRHDLVLWPIPVENSGLTCLSALTAGTPVLAYKLPPLTEFLTPKNSILVPCDLVQNALEVPAARPDPEKFTEYAQGLLRQRSYLERLQRTVLFNLDNRRNLFNDIWLRALTGPI